MLAAVHRESTTPTQQQPDYKARLQALLPFNVDPVLSSNQILTEQDQQNWTALLQAFWQVLMQEVEA